MSYVKTMLENRITVGKGDVRSTLGKGLSRARVLAASSLACLGWLTAACPQAFSQSPDEFQVKSAMVFNITKYVEWPAESFPGKGAALTICVVGTGPFGQALESLKGTTVQGRTVIVKHVSQTEEISACQVLVINNSERRQLPAVLAKARQHGVLSISDIPRFAQKGGIIGFVSQEGRIRLEVNLSSAQSSRIKISSQLLKLAKIVQEGDQ